MGLQSKEEKLAFLFQKGKTAKPSSNYKNTSSAFFPSSYCSSTKMLHSDE